MNKQPSWEKFERESAQLLGGSMVKGSGRFWGAKGDCTAKDLLVECKFTEKPKFYVTKKLVDKISSEARARSRIWMFCVRTSGGDYSIVPIYRASDYGLDIDEFIEKKNSIPVYGGMKLGGYIIDGRKVYVDTAERMAEYEHQVR